MAKEVDTRYTQDRELSWLRFNERVLEEAKDESVPLMERLKFAAIFTSNLDEFFMIRVGSLYDMTLVKEEHIDSRTGQTPEQQLQAIFKAVTPLYKQRDKVVEQLESRLRACNICRMSMDEMDTKERKQVENWFQDEVRPILSPQVVDSRHPFPHLSNKVLNIVLRLQSEAEQEGKENHEINEPELEAEEDNKIIPEEETDVLQETTKEFVQIEHEENHQVDDITERNKNKEKNDGKVVKILDVIITVLVVVLIILLCIIIYQNFF